MLQARNDSGDEGARTVVCVFGQNRRRFGAGAMCVCGLGVLAAAIAPLQLSVVFWGRFKMDVMNGQGLGC